MTIYFQITKRLCRVRLCMPTPAGDARQTKQVAKHIRLASSWFSKYPAGCRLEYRRGHEMRARRVNWDIYLI